LRRLDREIHDGFKHSRARHRQRRHHRSTGADPAPDGFRLRQGRQGRNHSAHFIQQLTFEHDGKNVFLADWGGGVSKDPYVKFAFKGGKKGDDLKISWVDNKGATDTITAKIQ